jgi:hypothetical protein
MYDVSPGATHHHDPRRGPPPPQLLEQVGELLGGPLELNLRSGIGLYSVAWEGAPVLVTLELGARFPADKPTVVLQCLR